MPCRRRAALLLTLAAAAIVPASASAALPAAPDDLPQLWGVVVDGRALPAVDAAVVRKLRTAGAAVIVDRAHLSAAQQRRLSGLTAGAGLRMLEPLPVRDAGAGAVACAALKSRRPGSRCGLMAGSLPAARAMSRDAMTDLVVARAPAPRTFAGLAAEAGSGRTLGVLDLAGGRYDAARWRAAIGAANRLELLDLAVRPAGRRARGKLLRFLAQLAKQAGADRAVPSRPEPAVAGLGSDSVSLAWPASKDKGGVAGYGLYRDGSRVGTTTAPAGRIGGLSCGAHVLEVDAVDRAGNRSAKRAVTAGPSGCEVLQPPPLAGLPQPLPPPPPPPPPPGPVADTTAPSRPAGLQQVAATETSVTLSWTPSTDAVGVAGYRVFRDGGLEQATGATSLMVTGLACGTNYELAVEAYDAAGNTSTRETLTALTEGCASPPPPTGLTKVGATLDAVTLSWTAPAGGGVAGYQVYVDRKPVETLAFTSVTVEDLTCGTTYELSVAAVDAAGAASKRAKLVTATNTCPDTTPPTTPGGLIVTGTTGTSVSLAWTASSDAVGVLGYHIFGGSELLETISGTSHTLEIGCGRTLTFKVRAFDAAGNESGDATVTAGTAACPDVEAPDPPAGIVASDITRTGLELTWSPSQDNVGVTHYRVFSEGSEIGSPTTPSLTVSGLQCGTPYVFGVEALDAAGNVSGRGFSDLVTTSVCLDETPPTRPGDLRRTAATVRTITAGWDASTDDIGVTGYLVYLDGELVEETQATSATFEWLTCGPAAAYEIGVEALDAAGRHSQRATLEVALPCDTTPPSAPAGLAVAMSDQDSITLEWSPAADDQRTARYHVDHDGEMAGSTAETSLYVPGLACGTQYVLGVRAFDASANGSPRSTLTAATADCPANPPVPAPATLFVATGGSDQALCTQQAPCRSFARAYEVASPGAVVEVAAGRYPAQRILAVPGRPGPDVAIRPAAGARVVFDQLELGDISNDNAVGPAHLILSGMHGAYRETAPGAGNQGGIFVGPGSSHVTLEDMDAGSLGAIRASHLTVLGGDYGPCDAVWGFPAASVCGNSMLDVSTDVLVDGARFHDYRFDETCLSIRTAECHWECMYVNGGERVTIRNSMFYGCTIFDIFTTISGPGAGATGHKDLTIENNWLAAPWTEGDDGGAPTRASAISLSWCQNSPHGYRDVRVGFNSLEVGTTIELDQNPVCTFDNVQVTGNLMAWDGCQERWAFEYNAWSTQLRSGTCSVTERVVGESFPYVEPLGGATMDYHLAGPEGPADDIAPAAKCPATDRDGQPRAVAGSCDAGADERSGAAN